MFFFYAFIFLLSFSLYNDYIDFRERYLFIVHNRKITFFAIKLVTNII